MKFAHPYLLNVLWVLIPVFGILVYGIRKQKKILSRFAGQEMFFSVVPGFSPGIRWIKAILFTLAAGFAIVALAGPQLGYRWEKTTQKGVDIMIALDCSRSMLAQDIKPNRLERAKREIVDLLGMMKSDRAGLVAFSGRAILQCPLTLDHEAFNIFLKVLEPGFLPVGGTNLDEAIKTSFSGFEKASDTDKAIIVITDGENTAGDVEATAKEMAEKGIKIFTIGVGDTQGAPIPDEAGGFKKDSSGTIILSKIDETGLEKLAALTGGTYVRSVAGDMDLDLIYTDKILGTMERKTLTSGKKKVWENRYQWFLFPSLVLLLIEFFLSSGKKSPRVSVFLFACIIGMAAPTIPVYAQTVSASVRQGIEAFDQQQYETAKKHFIDAQLASPENAKLYYNIGAAAYMNKEYEQARKNFLEAAKTKDTKLQHDARYNLANTDYRLGNLDEAIKGYEAILKDFPGDTEAKENLELARQKKQEPPQASDKDKKNPDDKKNQDKDKDKDPDKNPNQDKSKDQDKGQVKDQDEQNKDASSDQGKNRPDPSQPPRDKPSKGDRPPKDPGETAPQPREETPQKAMGNDTAAPESTPREPANGNLERMLNRLEDKPGQAMMPVLQKQYVEKDW